jgi:hypothetical protein
MIEDVFAGIVGGLFWAVFCSLVFFTFEAGHLFDWIRVWWVRKLTINNAVDANIFDTDLEDADNKGYAERAEAYLEILSYWAAKSKLAMLLICQVCFTTQSAVWLGLGLGFYFLGFDLFYYWMSFVLSAYFFSSKV